ncbi:MAG: hypothetical protein GY727_01935, partial [Gammaproteobacteria bacterium]|nr:hypothetical protein [Gammaproteobacteria bacterium]
GDDLGNHTATQNLNLNGNYLSGDGDNEGVFVNDDGRVAIGSNWFGSSSGIDFRVAGTTPISSVQDGGNSIVGMQAVGSSLKFGRLGGENLSSLLFIKDNGNVGIGTSNPEWNLHVSGANVRFRITDQNLADSDWDILAQTNGNEKLFRIHDPAASADRLVIDSTGTVGIGTIFPASSAQLEINSTTKGFLPPRMSESERTSISSPAAGLLVYQTTVPSGHYYYTGTDWIGITGVGPGAISTSSCIDYDGNTYPTFTIGDQVWMAENLRVTHYRNGDAIGNVTDGTAWSGLSKGAYCWYDNIATNEKYGALYNWYAVDDSHGLCPEGWHVPTHAEWTTLTTYLGGVIVAGGKMKATIDLWTSPNIDATNSSSSSSLPGGSRGSDGTFLYVGNHGNWWSSTDSFSGTAWSRYLLYNSGSVYEGYYDMRDGFSVRCLRD